MLVLSSNVRFMVGPFAFFASRTVRGRVPCLYVTFGPDGKTLAWSSLDHAVRLRDLVTGKEKPSFQGHTDWVYSVTFSPDGNCAGIGWQGPSGTIVGPTRGQKGQVNMLEASRQVLHPLLSPA
jgi:WD40 repeat protein